MNRFGNEPSVGSVSWCTVPPAFVRMPRLNEAPLQGPHHAAYQTPFWIAGWVIDFPAPVSPTIFQSQAEALHRVSQPLFWLSQTYSPPAIQCVGFVGSASYGAMNRGVGSHGFGVYVNAVHDGEISVYD